MSSDIFAIDLFCGAGGLTKGLLEAGISVVAGFDCDERCRYPYEHNNDVPFSAVDISRLDPLILQRAFPANGFTVLVGCAPCQPFSTYNQGKKEIPNEDKRWQLLPAFGSLVRQVRPDCVSMENVPRLLQTQQFRDFVITLRKSGYFVSYGVLKCEEFGVPQRRRRLVLLASVHGTIALPVGTHTPDKYKTVAEIIGDLDRDDPLEAGEASTVDRLHKSMGLTQVNLERIRQSKPGGSWRDWDEELLAECHRRRSGRSYAGVYGRMEWDKPAPTITTQSLFFGSGRFGHPRQDRALTLREAALLQSFPPDYQFFAEGNSHALRDICRLIGNAVPVKLAKAIGCALRRHLETLPTLAIDCDVGGTSI